MSIKNTNLITLLFLCSSVVLKTSSYKPVVFMHGLLSDRNETNDLARWIHEAHPGTDTFAIPMFENTHSLHNMLEQVQKTSQTLIKYMVKYSDGIHLVCFSQGGLICRGVLELTRHNVDTFISLSSPQAGQYGVPGIFKQVFPDKIRDELYIFAYTDVGQEISVCNYWNDPYHQDLYKKYSDFLAVFNNETHNSRSHEFKENFLRLKKLVMIGGPDDGVITPWQSSHFGFYDDKLQIQEMKTHMWYKEDSFGLQTLDMRGSLITYSIPGVNHTKWHSTKSVFVNNILPHLT